MLVRRVVLLSLFILSLISISFFGGMLSHLFYYAVLLIPVVCLAYLLYVWLRFGIHQRIRTRNIIAGEPVPYHLILSNQGRVAFTAVAVRLHSDYSFVADVPDKKTFTMLPGDRIVIDTRLTCKYRGEYAIGVEKLIITDFLGIFRVSYRMPSHIEAIVKPRINRLETLEEMPELVTFLQSHLRELDNEPDFVVRDYIPGDSLKKIHWKSTAKSRTLKVRNETGTIKQRIILMADLGRSTRKMSVYLPLENQILEQVIALAYYFVRQNIPSEFLFSTDRHESRMIGGIHQFNLLYEELAALHFRENIDFSDLLEYAAQSGLLAPASVIFMVVQKLDDGFFAAVTRLCQSGKVVLVYAISDADISAYTRQGSDRLRIVGIKP